MWKTIIRRVLLMIPQILILSILIFILADFMPGDPFTGLVDPNLDPAQLDAMREAYGLNDPLPVKYVRWMKNALQGDFGRSFNYQQPVTAVIAGRMGNTIRLSLLSIILTYLIGLPLGILAGRYNESILDKTVLVYNFVSFAVPIFVLALLMVWVFGYNLNWFPARGSISVNAVTQWDKWMSQLYHLLLPSITTAILGTTSIIQYLRSEIIDAKVSDYVKTARSKGVPIQKVYTKHIFRNASLPIASGFGFTIVSLFTGSIFIEKIFTYRGMGYLFLQSINTRDYSVIFVLALFYGFLGLIGTLLSDVILMAVDPRIRID
ncbi:MAG: ABC transporter permease [Alkalibacterium gilvum]|uniref:Peptide/nickel transport system permease protein n=1 Tax=Alkalibacterium gilvum TaxID=1130080 RepID=A0A1H6R0K6_9LACT|nr:MULTISPECIES: ABC transporter permease [Alkalibacterium]MDN6293426.1 ABC transporter permease [Alkalibacterium sp.]MDN6295818.1 ABC transporter permease [Alkalibacterium sp.]MDN6398060.1 ABC transporter permease [Alkalibacterium sp.]MDN6729464.1 ABC transporter permease [Alkalibacterium sp.]SEI47906.1 peptide/nickel transport system permease protein [Alkalibacterium gilvum]